MAERITEQQYRERLVGLAIMESGGGMPDWIAKCRENLVAQRAASVAAEEAERRQRSTWQRIRAWLTGNGGSDAIP